MVEITDGEHVGKMGTLVAVHNTGFGHVHAEVGLQEGNVKVRAQHVQARA